MIQPTVALGAPKLGFSIHWRYLRAIAQALTMVGIATVSLLAPSQQTDLTEGFHWSPTLLSQFIEEKQRPWYQSLKLWFGIFAAIWIWVYWRFW